MIELGSPRRQAMQSSISHHHDLHLCVLLGFPLVKKFRSPEIKEQALNDPGDWKIPT
jgi:hypothetical protein